MRLKKLDKEFPRHTGNAAFPFFLASSKVPSSLPRVSMTRLALLKGWKLVLQGSPRSPHNITLVNFRHNSWKDRKYVIISGPLKKKQSIKSKKIFLIYQWMYESSILREKKHLPIILGLWDPHQGSSGVGEVQWLRELTCHTSAKRKHIFQWLHLQEVCYSSFPGRYLLLGAWFAYIWTKNAPENGANSLQIRET